jgi:hypothetical protein
MNAQEMLLDYANANNQWSSLNAKEFIGMAFKQGVRIYRNGQNVIVRVARESKTVILTETVLTEGYDMETRQVVTNEATTEIFRVSL